MASRWAESALSWWEEAGVDTIVGEAPRDWLAARRTQPSVEAKRDGPAPAPAAPALPDELSAFQAWLAESDAIPFASPMMRRAAPAGDAGATGLMAVIDIPTASGRLFDTEAETLVDRMLKAIGLDRDAVYVAPFSPIRPPSGRIDQAGVDFLSRVMRHHIGLVSPKALLIFGDSCARALLGTPMAKARGRWHEVETPAGPVRAVVTLRPKDLLAQPKLKAHAWADLQLLTEGLKP